MIVSTAKRSRRRASARLPDPLLLSLGEQIRNLRAARGMSRKALAQDAGVSERFLADLETGVGNASILLLNKIADALALPVADIITSNRRPNADLTLSLQLLSKLSADELEDARKLLQMRFSAPITQAQRLTRIALVGLRGAGKSTLGRLLAEQLRYRFIELDQKIEELSGMDTAQIHVMLDQSTYRRCEFEALHALVGDPAPGLVIATPGSIVSEAETFRYLISTCFTIWVRASPEEHMARVIAQGDMRPMAGNRDAMNDLRRILINREPLYAKADATVDTSNKSVAAAFAILRQAIPITTQD